MWPFSETNAAAMRTVKTQGIYPESSVQSGEEHLPAWKRETKDQEGVTNAHVLRPKPLAKRGARAGAPLAPAVAS
jgi:hypothetical protein